MRFALSIFLAVQLAAADLYLPADLGTNPRAGCDYVLTSESGNITSPGFPNNYAANLNCSWLFFIPSGKSVQLSFTSFLLEQNFDFVRVSFIHLLNCSQLVKDEFQILDLRWGDEFLSDPDEPHRLRAATY